MTEKRPADRPREKLAQAGPEKLSDLELLMAIIGSGNAQADVTTIARRLLKLFEDKGVDICYADVNGIVGMGVAKTTVIMSALEFMKRRLVQPDRPIIDSLEAAVAQLADIRDKKQEHFVCLTLDGANRLIAKRTISIGTLTSSLVHPREVFADAITDRAASIIVAHNHPSGTLAASDADLDVTERLQRTGRLVGINVFSHLVLTADSYLDILR
jgi:DNA repair protein RadC